MYSFSYLEPVCSMSSSNCCFLTCIQISQEAGQVVWYSHLFQNFPQFIVIPTVKGFGIVNKAEIDDFLELSCFFDNPADDGNLISGSFAFYIFFLYFIFLFSIYFIIIIILLYNIVLVLPYINMHLPRVYTYSHPEPPSHLPPHTIPLGHPSAPAPSFLYPASNLDWRFISYMMLYMFQCHSPKSSHPLPLSQSP